MLEFEIYILFRILLPTEGKVPLRVIVWFQPAVQTQMLYELQDVVPHQKLIRVLGNSEIVPLSLHLRR